MEKLTNLDIIVWCIATIQTLLYIDLRMPSPPECTSWHKKFSDGTLGAGYDTGMLGLHYTVVAVSVGKVQANHYVAKKR